MTTELEHLRAQNAALVAALESIVAMRDDIKAAKLGKLVYAVDNARLLLDGMKAKETPVAPEKPAVKSGMFGKVEQDWIKKDFVATWYEGDNVRRQASGFATRAEANRFLKGKGVTVYPLKTFSKKTQFRS